MEQIEDKKYFLEWGSNPRKYYISRAEIEKYFVRFLVLEETGEFAFEIIWPLALAKKDNYSFKKCNSCLVYLC